MNWYIAKIVFQIISGEGNHTPQFDEQLRLINAGNERQAFEKASDIGLKSQERFINNHKQPVKWQFINVAEITLLNGLTDGTELYYTIQEPADAELYIKWANHKAALIGSSDHSFC
ncbi:DUF4288 domain-containing protein [Mucilaginibacter sp. HMF5004]|uniref:DUF4288 domain-containing protein n=1 Tax=Mucilaginibacter rivuli TaxID=2857527 RepID=UPI001C5F0C72|nr:DUF4288 domain-containing protein [Mucilaginibacter rivuli]MBW4888733.1 DUF4288 domain-containing protein [Mucilaginibacter rivuli]